MTRFQIKEHLDLDKQIQTILKTIAPVNVSYASMLTNRLIINPDRFLTFHSHSGQCVATAVYRRGFKSGSIYASVFMSDEEPSEVFNAIRQFAADKAFSIVTVEALGMGYNVIPDQPGHKVSHQTNFYLCDLSDGKPNERFSSNQRRNLRKALKQDYRLIEQNVDKAISTHQGMINSSNHRRTILGQAVAWVDDRTRLLIDSGYGRLFQLANRDNDVVSSLLIIKSNDQANYYIGGSSTEGMRNGASTLLFKKTMDILQKEGCSVLSLGIANESGLARFKTGLGAYEVSIERKMFEKTTPVLMLKNLLHKLLS